MITNLFSAVPIVGADLVQYLWGGFAVGDATLKRFLMLHFFLPFVLLFLTVLHVFFLHETGSNNPLGVRSSVVKIGFYPFRALNDLEGLVILRRGITIRVLLGGLARIDDPENFLLANPLVAPVHIQPE